MNIKRIPIEKIELNTGQIEGLPANPRQWTRDDIDRIAKSLKETPELFEMRPCIVFPHEDKYILLAGNLRFTGARQNEMKDVPCCVVPRDMSIAKMKEIVLKDNGSWGAWDFDALANEWDDLPLTDWGVPAWEEFKPSVEDTEREGANYDTPKMTFDFTAEEFGFVSDALARIDANKENALLTLLGYESREEK